MRPLLLNLDHFGSFREPAAVDFSDTEYFALVGPTGAGKSTIIDAICFALYGTVPRWGKENVISHALAPSAAAGKVGLVFESGGRRYGVVRSMARDNKGAVRTKAARLDELDPEAPLAQAYEAVLKSLAEGEHVTPEVQRLTGLEYKFFTQCVVLPQGRFAEFLHAAPRERQDLLVQLLDADVYERIRQRAAGEEEAAKSAAAFARGQLDRLSGASEEAEREAADRLAALRRLAGTMDTDLDLLRAREAEIRRAEQERASVAERQSALSSLRMPSAVPTLATARRAAEESIGTLTDEVAALEADDRAADEALAALGDRAEPMSALSALEARERLTAEAGKARAAASTAGASLEGTKAAFVAAEQAVAAAEHERERLRDAHAAAGLAHRLAVGEPCPVCLRPVTELPTEPSAGSSAELSAGRAAASRRGHGELADLGAADRALAAARDRAARARSAHAKAETSASMLAGQATRLESELAALPAPGDRARIEAALAAFAKADELANQARTAVRAARRRLDQARAAAQQVERQAESAWRTLESTRDRLLVLGSHDVPPPALDRGDLHRAWTELLGWRDQAARAAAAALAAREAEVAEAAARLAGDRRNLAERLAQHGVTVPREATPDQLGAAVAGAVARADGALERLREDRKRAAELERVVAEKEHEAKVAHELALRLRANAFERWLCAEALEVLVAGASDTLRELSDGQYELALADRTGDIEVIDHGEAGMRRSARTLSGGETFQAALALALALSGAVARGLDSIFLDEGFGTLDPATLDTVATTLERLASGRERMIGVVTHVPALAERVPVRFEVRRDAKGSHVRKAGL